ncbi:MAG: TerB family tellurite resistance protein [Alphaproteobacteria bacterium]|nr:TerB family tellurite resistance protein [Alphaproteobacteria bacterium]
MFERLKQELERHRQRPFLEAAMAACALIASADDEVSFSERTRMDAVLESLAELRIFDPHVAVNLFNDRLEALQVDRDDGRAAAFEAIRRGATAEGAGELLVRICVAISLADGKFATSERAMLGLICASLNLAPTVVDEAQAALAT